MKRSDFVLGSAGMLALAPRVALAQTLDQVALVGAPTLDMTPIFYAMRSGLYRSAGIDMQLVPATSGAAATTAVVAGTYQLSKGSAISSMVAYLRGLPLAVIANGGVWDPKAPFTETLVAADSSIRTAADLNGKICGTNGLNDMNQLSINVWCDKNGGDSKTLKWVEIPNTAAAEALINHRIEAIALNEPQLSAAKETGKVRVLSQSYSAISEHFVYAVYSANKDWAAKNPDVVRRWVKATYAAATYTNSHPVETEALVAEMTKIPVEIIRKIHRGSGSTSSDPRLLQPAIDAAARYNAIPHVFQAKEMYFAAG